MQRTTRKWRELLRVKQERQQLLLSKNLLEPGTENSQPNDSDDRTDKADGKGGKNNTAKADPSRF